MTEKYLLYTAVRITDAWAIRHGMIGVIMSRQEIRGTVHYIVRFPNRMVPEKFEDRIFNHMQVTAVS